MSDTEDTEEFLKTNSISSIKKQIIIGNNNENDELTKISTIELISDLFVNICKENKSKKCNENYLLKSFTNNNIPHISIKDYLFRLSKHAKVNESTIILILIYIDRICNMNHFILTYYNIHKLILASFILAIKYNEENYYSMIYYSKIGGVTLSEIKNLESEFLILVRYKLFVETKLFDKYYNDLMSLKDESEDDENEEEYEEYEDEEEDEEKEEEAKCEIQNNNISQNNEKNISKINNIDIYKAIDKKDNIVNFQNINYEKGIILRKL